MFRRERRYSKYDRKNKKRFKQINFYENNVKGEKMEKFVTGNGQYVVYAKDGQEASDKNNFTCLISD